MRVPEPDRKRLTRVTCSEHVTPILRGEVEQLGFEIQGEDAVSVQVGATLRECLDLNLRLRTALHVMWMLSRFRCPSPKALYKEIAAFPWESVIPVDGYFSVTSNVDNPKINNSMYPNLVVKDAIVDRISKHEGARPDSGPEKNRVVIHLYWKGDRAWVYLNTTGRWLADRGYRRIPHSAPMRETLAAAVLLSTGYDGRVALVNPMCGAGTLAIEGALIAAHRAPGLLRSNFSVSHTMFDVEDWWAAARRTAHKQSVKGKTAPIIATDHDPLAIDAARRNAKVAGVDHLIDFQVCDFRETLVPEQPGHVIMNPEYGERLGDADELKGVYKAIGDFYKQRCAGWDAHVFTGSKELADCIGLRAKSRGAFNNGQIECRLLSYEMYEGARGSSHP